MVQGRALPVDGAGEVFANKPPLALWLMRGAFVVLGPGPFAARLPTIVAAATTAVAIYLFAAPSSRRQRGSSRPCCSSSPPGHWASTASAAPRRTRSRSC